MDRRIVRGIVLAAMAWPLALAGGTEATASSLRFYGNGVDAPDLDRVKIVVDQVGNADPGPPADVGAEDFTIEFWMKAAAVDNDAAAVACGNNINWIYGNIVVDRDRFGQSRKFGLSLAGGRFVFGVSADGGDRTVCSTTNVLDGFWHHVAVQRDATSGELSIYVDGALDVSATGPSGDVSYPDDAVPCANCCGGGNCNHSDPFLVLGAEKHDAGASYPSYSGHLDELRLSNVIRYTGAFSRPDSPFAPDASTVALYHFDEGSGDLVADSSGFAGGPSDGERRYGGTPAGPEWSAESPFGSPEDLDGDGKANEVDPCTVLLASQRFSKSKIQVKGLGSGGGRQGMVWKARFLPATASSLDPSTAGLHLRLADDVGAIFDANVPAGLVGASPSTPCDSRDGWRVLGSSAKRTYLYRNYSGFLDAGCSQSAGGLFQIKLTDALATPKPSVRLLAKTKGSTLEVAVPPALIEASIAHGVEASPGMAGAGALAGDCGDYAWNPVSLAKPAPYCKLTPSPTAPTKVQCATP